MGEIAICSNFTQELNATGNSSFLRDDSGQLVLEHGHSVMWDYENKAGVALFARALVNVVNRTLAATGEAGKNSLVGKLSLHGAGKCGGTSSGNALPSSPSRFMCCPTLPHIAPLAH